MLINCHTQYSLKYGILSLEEVFIEIKKGGHDIFAVTDINNTSACMYALKEASNYGLQAAVGVDFRNGIRQQYVCVAKSCAGLKEINPSTAKRQALKMFLLFILLGATPHFPN